MPVNMPLDVETIGLVRRGSDIDVQAIFGGNITGRRLTGVKINPLFLEGHSDEDVRRTESLGRNGRRRKDPSIRLNVYDLRSPPGSTSEKETGTVHTVVKIAGHEIVSVSSSSVIPTSDVTVYSKSNSLQTSPTDIKVNIDGIYRDADQTSSHRSSDLSDYRTNESPYRPSTSTLLASDDDPDGGEDGLLKDVLIIDRKSADHTKLDCVDEEFEWPEPPDPFSPHELTHHPRPPLPNSNVPSGCHNPVECRTLKPILVRSQSSFDTLLSSSNPSGTIIDDVKDFSKHHPKSVKFADDTIDNENKTKRYVKERIDLSQVYRDLSLEAYGTVNPGFTGDLVKNVNNNHTIPQVNSQLVGLNIPSYMMKYLSDGGNGEIGNHPAIPVPPSTAPPPIPRTLPPENEESPGDTSVDTQTSDVTGYDAMVLKTAEQERRKQAIKWTVVTVVVIVLLVLVIALPVYFTSANR